MTDYSAQGRAARDLLRGTRELTQRVRAAQRATWFPLLLLGALVFASIPVIRFSHLTVACRTTTHPALPGCTPDGTPCHAVVGGSVPACSAYPTLLFLYWPVVLVLAYAAITGFYIRRSRARGVGTRIGPYAITGVALALLLTLAALWELREPQLLRGATLPDRLASAYCGIGVALLVLAWTERNRTLLAFSAVYLAAVLVPVTFGWSTGYVSRWTFLPRIVVPGTLLLLGAGGFAIAERARRRAGEPSEA